MQIIYYKVRHFIELQRINQSIDSEIFIYAQDSQYFQRQIQPQLKNAGLKFTKFHSQNLLSEYKQDTKNNILILCIGNSKNYKKYKSNFYTYRKIAIALNVKELQNREIYTKQIKLETNHGQIQIIDNNYHSLKQFILKKDNYQSIYLCNKDQALINRTLIIYDYFFGRGYEHNLQLFKSWLNSQGQIGKTISQIMKDFNLDQQFGKKIIPTLLGQNQVYLQAIQLLGKCQNPLVLPHISWFCNSLFKFIKENYKQVKNTLEENLVAYVYVSLTKQQTQKIKNSVNENFMFSTFKIGTTINSRFSDFKNNKSLPNSQIFKFVINIPPLKQLNQYLQHIDFGFYLKGSKIILNISNFYKIDYFNQQQRQVNVRYSIIGKQVNFRNAQFRYNKFAKAPNIRMMKLYDYFLYNKTKIQTQQDLIFSLRIYNYLIRFSEKEIYLTKKSNSNLALTSDTATFTNNDYSLSRSNRFNEKIAECYASLQEQKKAQQAYLLVSPIEKRSAGLLYLYYKNGNQTKFKQTVQLLKTLDNLNIKKNNKFLSIALNNFKCILILRKGNLKEASKQVYKQMNEIYKQFAEKYKNQKQFHNQAINSIPLYNILIKTCQIIDQKNGDKNGSQLNKEQYQQNWLNFAGTHIHIFP